MTFQHWKSRFTPENELAHHPSKIEFSLAIIIAIALIASLFFEKYTALPKYISPLLILAFLGIKINHIIKKGGTWLEDYTAIAAIVVFLIIYFVLGGKISSVLITVFVFILLYSAGLMLWVKNTFGSKQITHFIMSYIITIIMIIFLFAGAYESHPTLFTENNQQTVVTFEDAVYFSVVTITTVGYGDINPTGINRLLAAMEAFIGMTINVALLGYVLTHGRQNNGD